jgi:putative endonuclease
MDSTREKGNEGERIALQYLRDKGYVILETQWRWGRNEVDIIARVEQCVCFVEVKTRRSAWAGAPWESVNRAKQRAIIRAANGYLAHHVDFDAHARFDIVSIVLTHGNPDIEHIEGAFYAM